MERFAGEQTFFRYVERDAEEKLVVALRRGHFHRGMGLAVVGDFERRRRVYRGYFPGGEDFAAACQRSHSPGGAVRGYGFRAAEYHPRVAGHSHVEVFRDCAVDGDLEGGEARRVLVEHEVVDAGAFVDELEHGLVRRRGIC